MTVHPPDTAPYSQTNNPIPQPIQKEVSPEQMDIKKQDDPPDVISVPKELLSDFDSWVHNVLEYQW